MRGRETGDTWARRALRSLLVALVPVLVFLGVLGVAPFSNWSLNSVMLALLVLASLFLRFEKGDYGSREVAVVGALAAAGAAGRVLFAALPGVQPATFVAVLSGFVLGEESGFLVGSLIALLSNLFLGHGPWTPWQMLAWGMSGVSGGALSRLLRGKIRMAPIAVLTTFWGFLFGWILNLWYWLSFIYPSSLASYVATCAASFWFDLMHAAGNLVFVLVLGRSVAVMLQRYRDRCRYHYMEETWVEAAEQLAAVEGSGGKEEMAPAGTAFEVMEHNAGRGLGDCR